MKYFFRKTTIVNLATHNSIFIIVNCLYNELSIDIRISFICFRHIVKEILRKSDIENILHFG